MRTFIAIEMTSDIKAGMKELQDKLRASGADVAWTRPDGVHLTLKFLGEVDAATVDSLGAALEEAVKGTAPFTLDVRGTGVFPTPKSPRVVWLGLEGGIEALAALYEKVEAVCERLGFRREGRPFKPHVTLGRVKSLRGRESLMKALAGFEKVELGTIEADVVSVMKSELRPSGAVYTEMRRIELKAA